MADAEGTVVPQGGPAGFLDTPGDVLGARMARSFSALATRLEAGDPRAPLARGFVLARDGAGRPLTSAAQAPPGTGLVLQWLDGRRRTMPKGSLTVHQVDSHDTFWWLPWGYKFRRQQFGPEGYRAWLFALAMIDGGLIAQWSFIPEARTPAQLIPAACEYKGKKFHTCRAPTPRELDDLLFGWLVEAGVTSNSVLYVKDGVTVGVGTGEQDRVGVAEIARDKAYRKLADWISWEKYSTPYNDLVMKFGDKGKACVAEIDEEVKARKGGLIGCSMVSDAFFPFRDGAEVGIREGITAIVQPGGSVRDADVLTAVDAAGAAMLVTGVRHFRH